MGWQEPLTIEQDDCEIEALSSPFAEETKGLNLSPTDIVVLRGFFEILDSWDRNSNLQ